MAQHLMVDLETLDTKTSATILTLGAVRFDPFSNTPMKELYLRVDIDSQDALGCTVSDDTLKWWNQQDTNIMEEAIDPTDFATGTAAEPILYTAVNIVPPVAIKELYKDVMIAIDDSFNP